MGDSEKKAPNQCFAWTHGILCCLIGCGGAGLLGYCVFLQVTQTGLLPDLNLGSNDFLNLLLSTALAGIIVGAIMICVAIVGGFASMKNTCGLLFAIIYTIVMIALLAILIFIAVVTLKFATDSAGDTIVNTARQVWVDSVTNDEYVEVACQVQKTFECSGFEQGDCDTTPPDSDVCPVCDPPQTQTGLPGCYEAVVSTYDQYYEPIGIISSVWAGIVFLDLVAVWLI